MTYQVSPIAIVIFVAFVVAVLGLSFYFARKAKSASGYYAAGGQIHWGVNGIAFAGDYLSAASFLGIAGMIAKRTYESSMVIDLDEDTVNISLTLVFRFGVRIPDVAQAVQDVVRQRVEEFTGKHVNRVNVIVHDLDDVTTPRQEDEPGSR